MTKKSLILISSWPYPGAPGVKLWIRNKIHDKDFFKGENDRPRSLFKTEAKKRKLEERERLLGHERGDWLNLQKNLLNMGSVSEPKEPRWAEWFRNRVLGHSLVRLLVRSHRSLIRLLRTALFARALRCAYSFARLLTLLTPELVGMRFLCMKWTRRLLTVLTHCENQRTLKTVPLWFRQWIRTLGRSA